MHQMIQEHLPVSQKSRTAKDLFALEAELPRLCPGIVFGGLQSGARLARIFFEACSRPTDSNGGRVRWGAFEKSSSGVVKIVRPKPGNSATCGASLSSGIDLGCGTKPALSNGTRSSMVRVAFISASNSDNKRSANCHLFLLAKFGNGTQVRARPAKNLKLALLFL